MIAGRYRLEREIGRGGSGTVHLALDEVLGRPVAVKRIGMLPGTGDVERERAEREARLAAALNHPNVVAVFDLVDEDDARWLVMEYVDGETLSERVRAAGAVLAADAAALLDELGMAPAHVVGASMGGMIVQTMAIEQPQAVRSVVSIMSTTGDRDVGQPTPEATKLLFGAPPTTLDEALERARQSEATWGSPAHRDPEAAEARARREWERARNAAGVGRQLVAINASGSRTEALRQVTVPFTVIHGDADTLVTPSGGARTAEAVPHAVHVEIGGMGHNLPRPLWPQIMDAIDATVARTRDDDPTRHTD